ncbi:LysE family translocator [Pelagibacterium xiamenense]|uniref:LysE family translocator n=1 Tax=Pelagibacterium xiamenense TaxID=2901140 RepID=UPI001E389816|nr:LysE family translocator [Pelagibacterium xiamenense]MCD7060964.1 LysE family translocator [Pelagibacterium xiamenense]
MIDPTILITYIAACFLFSIVPGPSVSVVVANALGGGTRAGLLTILGTEISMFSMVLIVALGLEAVMAVVAEAFTIIKLIGAGYLIWIGWKMLTSSGELDLHASRRMSARRYIWQGALVNWANPKTLLFLGAFLPQFVDLNRPAFEQIMVLGLIVMAVATVTDALYAFASGQARHLLSAARVRLVNRVSGAVLICGGVWLALQRRA